MKKALLLLSLAAVSACSTDSKDSKPCTFTVTGAVTGSGTCTALDAAYTPADDWTYLQIEGSGGGLTLALDLWFQQSPDMTLGSAIDRSGTVATLTGGYYWDDAAYSFVPTSSDLTLSATVGGITTEYYDTEGSLVLGLTGPGAAIITVSF